MSIDLARVQTNMVRVDLDGRDARRLRDLLRTRGVIFGVSGPHRLRLVTHRHIRPDDVPPVVDAFRAALED